MKLILSQYLRTLKERDEFDRLLPDLLLAMGYVAVSKPQTGIRQYGVDLAVVGTSSEDGVQELLLFVIKCGDIRRTNWDTGEQAVRPSLNEVLDVYLKTHIEPAHEPLRKKVILSTTGDLKQDTQVNWDNYAKEHRADKIGFEFWGGDKVATLIEEFMLNEHLFSTEDRTYLRKSLALAGELDYDQRDLYRLFHQQLGLDTKGECVKTMRTKELVKALRVVNLSAQIFAKQSEEEGNVKQALIAIERALLWSWHRIQRDSLENKNSDYKEFNEVWRSYTAVAHRYFVKIQAHCYVQDGLLGGTSENALFSIVAFEQIGLLATIGLSQVSVADASAQPTNQQNANVVADALVELLQNNPVSGSPRLDENVIDITLGLLLLVLTGQLEQAKRWLNELVMRVDYTFRCKRNFPIGTDSIDDLVELDVFEDENLRVRLMKMSWLLPTLAAWAVIFEQDELYAILAKNSKSDYPEICMQLWHPTQDVANHRYYWVAQEHCGESEAPIFLPNDADEFRRKMKLLLQSEKHNVTDTSSARTAGIFALDFIACRHFRTPVEPSLWYRVLQLLQAS